MGHQEALADLKAAGIADAVQGHQGLHGHPLLLGQLLQGVAGPNRDHAGLGPGRPEAAATGAQQEQPQGPTSRSPSPGPAPGLRDRALPAGWGTGPRCRLRPNWTRPDWTQTRWSLTRWSLTLWIKPRRTQALSTQARGTQPWRELNGQAQTGQGHGVGSVGSRPIGPKP